MFEPERCDKMNFDSRPSCCFCVVVEIEKKKKFADTNLAAYKLSSFVLHTLKKRCCPKSKLFNITTLVSHII